MSDCAGCDHPEKYGHNAYCPESRIDELKERLAEAETALRIVAEQDWRYDELKSLLRWLRRYVPEHDDYFHNPYTREADSCDVCQKRNRIDALLGGTSEDPV